MNIENRYPAMKQRNSNVHFVPAGRIFPMVWVGRELSTWQKLRGEPPQENIGATWTLAPTTLQTPDQKFGKK